MEKVKESGVTDWRAHGLSAARRSPSCSPCIRSSRPAPQTGCPAHVVHCSLGRGYDIAARLPPRRLRGDRRMLHPLSDARRGKRRQAPRRQGQDQSADPPARRGRDAVAQGRRRATSALVSTDHVSWSENRKTNPDMLANASGVPGLEVMVPLFVKGAIERGVPLTWAARLMAENPAKHFRLDHVKGALDRRQGCRYRRARAAPNASMTRPPAATTSSAGAPTTASACPGPFRPPGCAARRSADGRRFWPSRARPFRPPVPRQVRAGASA